MNLSTNAYAGVADAARRFDAAAIAVVAPPPPAAAAPPDPVSAAAGLRAAENDFRVNLAVARIGEETFRALIDLQSSSRQGSRG